MTDFLRGEVTMSVSLLDENEYLIKLYYLLKEDTSEIDEIENIEEKITYIKEKSSGLFSKLKSAYNEYKNKYEGKSFFSSDFFVDLRKIEVFFNSRDLAKGNNSEGWLYLADLHEYLLKQIVPYRLIQNGDQYKIMVNNMILPKIVRASGLESAEYYITTYYEKDEGEDEEFLITPCFLSEGEELIHINDVAYEHEREITKVEKNIVEYLTLRHFKKEQIESVRREYIKQAFVSKFFRNCDENNGNVGMIVDKDRNVRLAPMFDFDYYCGIERTCQTNVEKTVNGKIDIQSFLEYYKTFDWFMDWLNNSFLTIEFDSLDFYEENKNKIKLSDKTIKEYKNFFESRKKRVQTYLDSVDKKKKTESDAR